MAGMLTLADFARAATRGRGWGVFRLLAAECGGPIGGPGPAGFAGSLYGGGGGLSSK